MPDSTLAAPSAPLAAESVAMTPVNLVVRALHASVDGKEILQLAILRPRLAILDETDSGLDVDALRTVAAGVMRVTGPDMGLLIITHYPRILEFLRPDRIHVMHQGRIVTSGDADLAQRIEAGGYEPILGAGADEPSEVTG